MPSLRENLELWNSKYAWAEEGDEWSAPWGGSELQWWASIFPRIRAFVPTGTILEIAPGFGRWTQFLVGLCDRLILVDLTERCIEACKKRFGSSERISYHVNDGKSLDMVPDRSLDFIFSFDSLVHAEADVMRSYLLQLGNKLKPDGVGFIHHSNMGAYPRALALAKKVRPRLRNYLIRAGLLVNLNRWGAESMTAELFQQYCEEAGLRCISQEKINWRFGKHLIDCFSVFTPKGSVWERAGRVVRNARFMETAHHISRLGKLYPSRKELALKSSDGASHSA